MALLEVNNLEVYYGVIRALKGISFKVEAGEIVALIGANGAGKTTTLHTITGLIPSKNGSIIYNGEDITRTPAHKIVTKGISHVPESRRIFAQLSVEDNLALGAFTRKDKTEIATSIKKVYEYFPILQERKSQLGGTLSGGEQQMLAMGRAIMSKPKLIVMDEPSMGLSPLYVQQIFDIIKEFHKIGTTILLVEQNAEMALNIAERAYVYESGNIVLTGKGKELAQSDSIKKAYLGG